MRNRDLAGGLTPAGRRVLDVAADLFYRQGIHAVGVDMIAAEAGVTKKTLYACFGSKDQLVTRYLSERDQRWREWLTTWAERHGTTVEEKPLGVFDALDAWMMDRDEFRGCGFVNALAELPSADHPAHAVILEQKQWMRDYFATLAERAGIVDIAKFAETAFLLYEGATVAASANMPQAVPHAKKATERLLKLPE